MSGIRAVKLVLIAVFCLSGLTGCSTIKEATRQVMGISTKEVEASRKDALTRDFNLSYDDCYAKALKTLAYIGSYVYMEDKSKNLVAVYFSEADTTVAGVFFDRTDADNTRVEVCSPSTYAKEYIAAKLFAGLDGTLDLDEKLSADKTVEQDQSGKE
jgi:hypothetical protein